MYTFERNEIKVGRNFVEGQLFRDYDGARFFSYYNNDKSAWEGRKMIYYYLAVVCRFHERRYFIVILEVKVLDLTSFASFASNMQVY
jgi:hypothetical protein